MEVAYMLTYLKVYWQNSAWVNEQRETWTYDANGYLVSFLDEFGQGTIWINETRITYTNDVNGNMLTDLYEEWQNNAWVNSYRYTYTYDINGAILTDLTELWQNNAWINYNRYTYTYDANDNSIIGKEEIWTNNTWVLSYNNSNLNVYSNKNIIKTFSSNDSTALYNAHFISFFTGIKENTLNNNVSIYPNPTKDNLTIETNLNTEQRLEIVNLIGQTIYTTNINKKATINTSAFAKGVYILKLSSDKETVVRKFVKE